MGRPGITFDQVAIAAQALESEGTGATLQAVRDRLGGTGSMNTIQRHLKAWRANQPKEPPTQIDLPADVVRTMNAWAIQASTAARAEAESEMLRAQAEADLLAKAGIDLEAERDRLLEDAGVLTTQRDQAEALAKERADEVERMTRDLEREREVANAAQIKTAESQLKLEAQAQQLADLKAEVSRLNSALDAERQTRAEVQTRAAVLQAELSAVNKEAEAERTRADGLQSKLEEARKEEEELRDDLGQQLQKVAALTAEVDAARKVGTDMAERIRSLEAQVDKAQAENQSVRDAYESRMQGLEREGKEAIAAERAATEKARTEAHALALQAIDLTGKLGMAEEKLARLESSVATPNK